MLEFAEGRYQRLMNIIKEHCRDEYLPRYFREWKIIDQDSPDSKF
ncbi:MAG: hypothetical protein ACYC4L_12830 [Chloroflexota bacterium]